MTNHNTGDNGFDHAFNKYHSIDAVELLKVDHRKVNQLFDQFLNASPTENQGLAVRIFRELKVHSLLEEELFYPALHINGHSAPMPGSNGSIYGNGALEGEYTEGNGNGDVPFDAVISAYDDHRLMRDQIRQLLRWDISDPRFRQGMAELHAMVFDHVTVEEAELFPHAQLILDLSILGLQIQQRRAALLSEAWLS